MAKKETKNTLIRYVLIYRDYFKAENLLNKINVKKQTICWYFKYFGVI